MKINCLFIGGSVDGQRISIDESRISAVIKLPVPANRTATAWDGESCDYDPSFDEQLYRVVQFHKPSGESIKVFAFEGLAPDEIFERLIENYHPLSASGRKAR